MQVGYGIAFGSKYTPFVGQSNFGDDGFVGTFNFSNWVFQTALAAAANSIVSGGAAERMTFFGYVGLSLVFSGIIYPFAAHWGFGNGFLMSMGYHDFAGSGTIHAVGGVGALMTTLMLKPRKGRYESKHSDQFEANNPTFICLGTLSVRTISLYGKLWTCWIFFNAGSTLSVTNGQNVVMARAAMNTMLSGSSGALTVFLTNYYMNVTSTSRYNLVMLCNGNLAGLVAITAYVIICDTLTTRSCDNVEPWAAFTIGILGGFAYMFANRLLHHLQIDDPIDAVPVHLVLTFECITLGLWHPGHEFGVVV